MKKIIIYADDDKADQLAELLSHLDLIRSIEVDVVQEARIYQEGNFEIKPSKERTGYQKSMKKVHDDELPVQEKLKGLKNIEQLREALSAIESIRDKNKKRFGR